MLQETDKPTTSQNVKEEKWLQNDKDKKEGLLQQFYHSPGDPKHEQKLEKVLRNRAEQYFNLGGEKLLRILAQRKCLQSLGYVLRVLPFREARRWRSSCDLYGAIFQQPSDTAKALECLRVLDLFTNLYSLYLITRKAKGKLKSKLLQV